MNKSSITINECIEELLQDIKDKQQIFFFGAGCSLSSGIPSASQLARKWFEELPVKEQDDLIRKDYTSSNAGKFYQHIYKERFKRNSLGKKAISKYMQYSNPGAGYAAFAKYLSKMINDNNYENKPPFVLTVNFDDLLEQAFILYSSIHPQIISDAALADFINDSFFSIIKLHGDYRLAPENREKYLQSLMKKVKVAISKKIHDADIIFIGYSGNDESIADMMSYMHRENKNGINNIYWINSDEPGPMLKIVFEKYFSDKFVWVNKYGSDKTIAAKSYIDFDEFMLELLNRSKNSSPNVHLVARHIENHHKFILEYHGYYAKEKQGQMDIKTDDYLMPFIDAAKHFDASALNYKAAYDILYSKYEDYKNYPAFVSAYAHFIKNMGDKCLEEDNLLEAERFFNDAIHLDNNNAEAHAGKAIVQKELLKRDEYKNDGAITDIRNCFMNAEIMNPSDYNNILNYAGFLLATDGSTNPDATRKLKDCQERIFTEEHFLEYDFYSFVHSLSDKPVKTLNSIQNRLKNDIRSRHYDFNYNVHKVKKEDIKDEAFIELAGILADVISDNKPYDNTVETAINNYKGGLS